jgi:hypothetical protein
MDEIRSPPELAGGLGGSNLALLYEIGITAVFGTRARLPNLHPKVPIYTLCNVIILA